MAELHLKPARQGDIIRDPISGHIMPAEGETKPRNPHWLRRLGRKEVAETTAEAIAKGKKEREAKEADARAATESVSAEPELAAEPPAGLAAAADGKARKGKE